MRPRFSIKWLLIAFTIFGVAFYFCFVRPTVTANRFIAAVEDRDFSRISSLVANKDIGGFEVLSENWERRASQLKLNATLVPQNRADLLSFQRRLEFSVGYPMPGYPGRYITETTSALAHVGSVTIEYNFPYYVH